MNVDLKGRIGMNRVIQLNCPGWLDTGTSSVPTHSESSIKEKACALQSRHHPAFPSFIQHVKCQTVPSP